MTLEEIRAAKTDSESRIAEFAQREIDALANRVGIVAAGMEIDILIHETFGNPDFSLILNCNIDLGKI